MSNIINIRDELNKIDLRTDNKYDLRNLYESIRLSDTEKKQLVRLLSEGYEPKYIYNTLNSKLTAPSHNLNEHWTDVYRKFVDIANNSSSESEAERRVDALYSENEGNPDYELAMDKWLDAPYLYAPIKSDKPLYVIRDRHGRQLSAPNHDDQELWDRVSDMEMRGKTGLSVVAYTEGLTEETKQKTISIVDANGKPISSETVDANNTSAINTAVQKANQTAKTKTNSKVVISDAEEIKEAAQGLYPGDGKWDKLTEDEKASYKYNEDDGKYYTESYLGKKDYQRCKHCSNMSLIKQKDGTYKCDSCGAKHDSKGKIIKESRLVESIDYSSIAKQLAGNYAEGNVKPAYHMNGYVEIDLEDSDDAIKQVDRNIQKAGFERVDYVNPDKNGGEGWYTYVKSDETPIVAALVFGPDFATLKVGYDENEDSDLFEEPLSNDEYSTSSEDDWDKPSFERGEEIFAYDNKEGRVTVRSLPLGEYTYGVENPEGDFRVFIDDEEWANFDFIDDVIDYLIYYRNIPEEIANSLNNYLDSVNESLVKHPDPIEGPYSKKAIERDLKDLTDNFTRGDTLKCGYAEEDKFAQEILNKHYNKVSSKKQGEWFVITFSEPKSESVKESKLIESQNSNPAGFYCMRCGFDWEEDLDVKSKSQIRRLIKNGDIDCPDCGSTNIDLSYFGNEDDSGVFEYTGKSIPDNMRKKIRSVIIKDSVTELDYRFAEGGGTFEFCTRLSNVTIPNSVTKIGVCAFRACKNLKSIEIPSSVTRISDEAFSGCTNLTRVTIGNPDVKISKSAFWYCPNVSIEYLGGNNSSLTEAYDDGDVYVYTGGRAPEDVVKVVVEDGVKEIDYWAFMYCEKLESIKIPNSVTEIGNEAFERCESLTSVEIPNSVTKIGRGAFSSCVSLTNVSIPESVTSIFDSMLMGCKSLTSIEIPNSVTTIDDSAFAGCVNLKAVKIPDGVTSIGRHAFAHCESLASVTIPKSVETISRAAFKGCRKLKDVKILNPNIKLNNDVFKETPFGKTFDYNSYNFEDDGGKYKYEVDGEEDKYYEDINDNKSLNKSSIITEASRENMRDIDALILMGGGTDECIDLINRVKEEYPGIDNDELADILEAMNDDLNYLEWLTVINYFDGAGWLNEV